MTVSLSRRGRRRVIRLAGVFSPAGLKHPVSPTACLNKKNGISPLVFSKQKVEKAKRTLSPPSPCNIYMGSNFAVRLHEYFKFVKLTGDNAQGGVSHTHFNPRRRLCEMNLSLSAQRILTEPNAGGNSVLSEVLSFELFQNCFKAKLLKTEMEVSYFPYGGSITDYVCEIFGYKVGVSVTRAMKYHGEFTEEDAEVLLNKKLKGVVQSSKNSLEKWNKQILHIWAANKDTANILTTVYDTLASEIRSNTVVMITVPSHADYIFTNK